MGRGKALINDKHFRDILVCLMWPATINYGSGILARQVGRDMWMSGIISVITVLPFMVVIIHIGKSFPEKTIVQYSTDLLGRFFGKALGVILTLYFFLIASSTISMYVHHLTGFLLPETPFLVVTALHIFIICYLVWKGPEVIGRVSIIAFAMAIIFYLIVFAASLSEINIDRILPVFDSGVLPVLISSKDTDTFIAFSPLVAAMFFPMVNNKNKALRAAVSGLFIGSFFFILYFIVELMVMGPQVVAMMRIASMDFVRAIQITQYLHRFESFMVALWYWSIMIHAGTAAYCSLESFKQITGIKKKSPFLIIAFGLSLLITTYYIGHNDVIFLRLREHIWEYISLPVDFAVPLVLLLALGIKNMVKSERK